MKNNRIALKLSRNFAIALLIFSLIIGGIFFYLFRSYTVEIHKNELVNYAESLSSFLSSEEGYQYVKRKDGYGSYLRFIVDVADIDVWIVDEDIQLTTVGKGFGHMNAKYNLSSLPTNAEELISKVLEGDTEFSEGFSETLNQPTLTLGLPIINPHGQTVGALLLHSPIEGINLAVKNGIYILLASMLLALVITIILSIFLSYSFTKPLNKMKDVAFKLSEGEYKFKCDINQDDEIGELANAIDLLSVRLEEASKESGKLEKLRREFVANISHELRTPITVIRGSLEALNDKVITDGDKINDYYIQMLNEAKFLEHLVNDLLDLSTLQNIDFVVKKKEVNINDLIRDVLRSANQLASKKNLKINKNITKDIVNIQGDYGRLRQMFLILIDNAIKFSPNDSSIEILVTSETVSIRDYGFGINKEDLPYIFNRFYKTLESENKTGTGLGLAIAKEIAERHDIQLVAKNHPDGGAQFICYLV